MYERPYNKSALTYPEEFEPVIKSIKPRTSALNSSLTFHLSNHDTSQMSIS